MSTRRFQTGCIKTIVAATAALSTLAYGTAYRAIDSEFFQHLIGRKTVIDRVAEYGPAAHHRIEPYFERAGVEYPPKRVVLLGLKRERCLCVYAAGPSGQYRFVHRYPFHAASGLLGPKLKEGDYQVPEGIYPVEELNPNSLYHLSLRVGYPNDFDRAHAAAEGRTDLGGDIMIHGGAKSVGCMAMGDSAAEDLFVLAADTGIENVKIVIAPVDFRRGEEPRRLKYRPSWLPELYSNIREAMANLPPDR
jgi:hypothetical protein